MATDSPSVVASVQGLDAFYGKSQALHGIDLSVHQGDVLAVVGRNGAGKTTLMNALVGILRKSNGKIELHDHDISGWAPHRRVRAGLGYVPSAARLFRSLTVEQNLIVSAPRGARSDDIERSLALFAPLRVLANRRAGALSGGERQMVAIARAMIRQPSLLLLDEPTEGLSPLMVNEVATIIQTLRSAGVTMVLCEQNTAVIDESATRIAVIEKGRIVVEHDAGVADYRSYLGVA